MTLLLVGLILFLGTHSLRIFAEDWRAARIARMGELRWKGIYAVVSLIGFVLLVQGYGDARLAAPVLWQPPVWTRHVAAVLMLPAMILLVAAYVPRNRIKARLGHPMLLGTKLWAAAHLIANGTLADLCLFGAFLVWAILAFRSCRRRDGAQAAAAAATEPKYDVIVVAAGVAAWGVFARYLHLWMIGVAPFGA